MRIAVLGGGIAGLAAAYRLKQSGHDVVLFEASDRLGGNIRTGELEGCRVEWGPNGWLDNEPLTLALAQDLGLEGRLVRARASASRRFVWRQGKLRELPTKPQRFLWSDILPATARLRVLYGLLRKGRPPPGDESVHAFAARRLGKGAADVLVDAFVTGVFAGDPKRLSLKSAFPKLAAAQGSMPKMGPPGTLTSFDQGMQLWIDTLAEHVDVRLSTPWQELARNDFDHVVCTAPAPRAAALAAGELAELLQRIPTAPVAVVATIFDEPLDVPDAFGFLVPRGQGLRILGTLYDSSIFDHRAPKGVRLFRTMVGGRRDPDAVALDDGALLEIVARDLRRVWGAWPEPRAVQVIRHPLGIPQYELGHADLLERIERASPAWLRLAGSSYRGVALNACIREAVDWTP